MKIINYEDKLFPIKLKQIENPPKRLYAEGNERLLEEYSIAVIGSRDCSNYGVKWCEEFAKKLLEYNLVIVSGMANGIDTIAHKAALKYGGKTIAVLPCGLNKIYPKENIDLYKKIIESDGLVITEYEPNVEADSKKFLERNRIVAGLAIGTLVIEAEKRSGTSVTARLTNEQGKKVFCLPGSLDNRKSIGTNRLIQDGANLVIDVEDIIKNYDYLTKSKTINRAYHNDVCDVDDEYKEIYKYLSDIPVDINELSKKSNMSIKDIGAKLTMLELDGKVKRIVGNKFVRGDNNL